MKTLTTIQQNPETCLTQMSQSSDYNSETLQVSQQQPTKPNSKNETQITILSKIQALKTEPILNLIKRVYIQPTIPATKFNQ